MSKFLIDENLSPLIAVHLRRSGYKARAVRELRLTGKSDEVILNYAQKNRFIIVTGDVEFGKFFYERYGTLTIIILRSRTQSFGTVLKIINNLEKKRILAMLPERGYLILADDKKVRIRKYLT